MVQKTYGDPIGFYYRIQSGDDDKLKKQVNRYVTSRGTCQYAHTSALDNIGNWVQQDPLTYCSTEWYELIGRMAHKYHTFMDDALLLADLYYARSTIDLAVVYAKKVLKVVRALKRRDVKAIKYYFSKHNSDYGRERTGKRKYHRALTEVPEAWLTMSFVVNPLRGTIKNFCEVINNPLMWRKVDLYAGKIPFKRELNHGYWGNIRHEEGVLTGYGHGFVRFKNPNEHFVERLGLTDLIGTVWDIVPWSWALEYFFKVSEYWESLNPRYNNFEWTNLYYGIKMRRNTVLEFNQTWYPGWLANHYSGTSYHRFPGAPTGASPRLQFDLNLDQIANLLSAIALTFSRKFNVTKLG